MRIGLTLLALTAAVALPATAIAAPPPNDNRANARTIYTPATIAGTTYRVNLADGDEGCVTLEIYPPGTDDFDEDQAARTLRCGGYALFTPKSGEGGRYSFRALARERVSGPQPYRLQVARAGADDTAPGARLANLRRVRGSLRRARRRGGRCGSACESRPVRRARPGRARDRDRGRAFDGGMRSVS